MLNRLRVSFQRAGHPVNVAQRALPGNNPQADPLQAQKTVLYIEDNRPDLDMVKAIFRRRPQIKLMSATHGRLGIDLAREHQPDLVLLDMKLPDIPGQLVLEALRQGPHGCNIPVIVVSADAAQSKMDQMIKAGAMEYITKPFSIAKFLSAVDNALYGTNKN